MKKNVKRAVIAIAGATTLYALVRIIKVMGADDPDFHGFEAMLDLDPESEYGYDDEMDDDHYEVCPVCSQLGPEGVLTPGKLRMIGSWINFIGGIVSANSGNMLFPDGISVEDIVDQCEDETFAYDLNSWADMLEEGVDPTVLS